MARIWKVPGSANKYYYEGDAINGRFANVARPAVTVCGACGQSPCACIQYVPKKSDTFRTVVERQRSAVPATLTTHQAQPHPGPQYRTCAHCGTWRAAASRQPRRIRLQRPSNARERYGRCDRLDGAVWRGAGPPRASPYLENSVYDHGRYRGGLIPFLDGHNRQNFSVPAQYQAPLPLGPDLPYYRLLYG